MLANRLLWGGLVNEFREYRARALSCKKYTHRTGRLR